MDSTVDNRTKLTAYAIKKLFAGEGLRAHGLCVRLHSVGRRSARLTLILTDSRGVAIADICSGELQQGMSLTAVDLDRVFTFHLST